MIFLTCFILLSNRRSLLHILFTILRAFLYIMIKACLRHKKLIQCLLNSVALIKNDDIKSIECYLQKRFTIFPDSGNCKSCYSSKNNRTCVTLTKHFRTCANIKIRAKTMATFARFFQRKTRFFTISQALGFAVIHSVN